ARTPPNDLRIAGEGGAIGAKQAGCVVLRVRQQLGVKGAEKIGRHGDDGNPRKLARGANPAAGHGEERLVVEERLKAADINIGAGLAQRLEVVATGYVQKAGGIVAGADQQMA